MKKLICAAVAAIFVLFCICGCERGTDVNSDTVNIVCTVFPLYDWVKNITDGAEGVNVILLCDNGTDMHSYQPSAKDIFDIESSDVLIGIGGESDGWVFDAVDKDNSSVTAVKLMDLLCDRIHAEEISHSHSHDEIHEHEHAEPSFDEHVWLSLKNASIVTEKLAEILIDTDSANSEVYKRNSQSYISTLDELDRRFSYVVENSERKTVVFADRFPFVYLFEDYGVECHAAFPGCSADTDASFDTVISLAEKLDEYSLDYVAVTENTDGKTAKAVIENSADKKQQIVVLDSMQSVTAEEINDGVSYVSVMENNLKAFEKLLG